MSPDRILWVTCFIMAAGGLALLFTGKRRTATEELTTVCHGIVPLIAACSYFAMATGQGAVHLPTAPGAEATRVFYYARYVDWLFTTPLLLLTLSFTAMHEGAKRHGAVVGVVLADVMMIVTAFAFGASVDGALKWTWFAISCAAFLGVYYVLWVPNMEASAAQRGDVRATYRRHNAILSFVWLLYPLALALGADGLGVIADAAGVLSIAVLDVIAKVFYGFLAVHADTRETDRELAEAERTPPLTAPAAAGV